MHIRTLRSLLNHTVQFYFTFSGSLVEKRGKETWEMLFVRYPYVISDE